MVGTVKSNLITRLSQLATKEYKLRTLVCLQRHSRDPQLSAVPKGLSETEFEQRYGTEAACREALFHWRGPEGFECPICGERRHGAIKSRQLFQCSGCRRQTSLTAGTIFAATQVPLSPVTAPHLDTHVAVLVPYTDQTEKGYPGRESLGQLRDLEDHLAERVGSSGRVVAHQSHRGMRVLHLYVDSSTPAVEQMRAAVTAWPQGRIRVQVTADPGWRNVAHLRG